MQDNENRAIFTTVHKSQVEVDEGPQHKMRYDTLNLTEEKAGMKLNPTGTKDIFFHRTSAQALR